jgi:cyanophycinase
MLALVGSGEYLPPMDPVDRYLLAQLPMPGRVVCLPTAAGTEGDERIQYWSNLGVAHFTRLGVQVEALPVIDRTSALEQRWAERIRQANFVYLSGGNPGYLYQTLNESPVWQAIESVHRQGGVVAGCSAGAMIMGERIPGFSRWQAAFGLLPGMIVIPHFDEIPQGIVRTVRFLGARQKTLLGIEGNTALVVFPERCEVVGSGSVVVWDRTQQLSYRQGDEISCASNGRADGL